MNKQARVRRAQFFRMIVTTEQLRYPTTLSFYGWWN